jgi:hypothetical protein
MHTVSELAHTSDVMASIAAIGGVIESLGRDGITAEKLQGMHPRLDRATEWKSEQ